MAKELSFLSELKATGHGEVWDHSTDRNKFRQFGWRCTTNESAFSTDTLIGNWNEQRFDIHRMFQPQPIPSSYSHYFETTYVASHGPKTPKKVPASLRSIQGREPTAYPGHQPELDSALIKSEYNSFMTTSREAYRPPNELRDRSLQR